MPKNPSHVIHAVLVRGMAAMICLGGVAGCKSTDPTKNHKTRKTAQLPPEEAPEPETFHFCPVNTVKQSNPKSGGLAALTSVLNYWDLETNEPALLKKYPPTEETGYHMNQLRRIATDEGLMAFALTMKMRPLDQLSEQLEHGRPVLVSVKFADGEYFGKPAGEVADLARASGIDVGEITGADEYYVVVFGQSENQFLIMDPALGVVSIDKKAFAKYWKEEKYSALLCSSY